MSAAECFYCGRPAYLWGGRSCDVCDRDNNGRRDGGEPVGLTTSIPHLLFAPEEKGFQVLSANLPFFYRSPRPNLRIKAFQIASEVKRELAFAGSSDVKHDVVVRACRAHRLHAERMGIERAGGFDIALDYMQQRSAHEAAISQSTSPLKRELGLVNTATMYARMRREALT